MAANLNSGGFDAISTFKVELLSKKQKAKTLNQIHNKNLIFQGIFFQNVMFWIGSHVFDNF